MDQDGVFTAYFMLELTDGFQERLALYITHGTAHLDDGDPCFLIRKIPVKTAFDLIGNMRDNLYGSAAIIPAPFLLKNGPVYFSGRYIRIFVQIFVDKSFIMP